MIRAVIVDDEPLARERVRSLLAAEKDIEIAGECVNGKEAIAAVRELHPDLLFLDIQMPGLSGFDVLRELDCDTMPLVIFVTAYDQHALKAFEVHALDYLLKPFKQARFRETLQRARATLSGKDTALASRKLLEFLGQAKISPEYLMRLTIKNGERVVLVRVDQVDYFESAGNYVVVHAASENHVLRETLTALEQKLSPRQFLRISRSTLVNLDKIKELQPLFKGEHAVILQSGKQLTMTRGLREVQQVLKFS